MTRGFLFLSCLVCTTSPALAQGVSVDIQGGKVQVQTSGSAVSIGGKNGVETWTSGPGNSAEYNTGIAPDAQIQGVTVINGDVTIDGEHVPASARTFKSRSGKTYVIERSGGGVSVRSE